jgi:hypothetical protein
MSVQDSEDSTHYSETVGTRLAPQTKRQFDQYKQDNEIGNAEAARRLIRDSLGRDETLDQVNKLSLAFALAYLAVYAFSGPADAGAVGAAYIAALVIWSSYPKTVARLLS